MHLITVSAHTVTQTFKQFVVTSDPHSDTHSLQRKVELVFSSWMVELKETNKNHCQFTISLPPVIVFSGSKFL